MQIKATTHHGQNYDVTEFTAHTATEFKAALAKGFYPYDIDDIKARTKFTELVETGATDVGWTRYQALNTTLDGVLLSADRDGLIGWMSNWGAPWDHDWLDKGWVTTVEHNSGGLGGFSFRVTEAGWAQITKEVK